MAMKWDDAIREVLAEEGKPMHYKDITQKIIEKGDMAYNGDTPENTVNRMLNRNTDLFKRVKRGYYGLVEILVTTPH